MAWCLSMAARSAAAALTNSAEFYRHQSGHRDMDSIRLARHSTRDEHTATLLPNGKVLVAGGENNSGALPNAELYDVGLGFSPSWQPLITSVHPLLDTTNGRSVIVISGSKFRGISEGSGGNEAQDSPADYPVMQLLSLANSQTMFLSPGLWSGNLYESIPASNFPSGYALVTAFVNGIPSAGNIVNLTFPPQVSLANRWVRRQWRGLDS